MTKQEILDAINATIVTNGQKGITAESLANILIEIVNAVGEGNGGVGGEYIDMTMANPEDSTSTELTAEAKAHNAEVYIKLFQALTNNIGTPYISIPTGDNFNISVSEVKLEEVVNATNIVLIAHMPIDGSCTNFMLTAVELVSQQNSEVIIGADLTLVVFILQQDGQVAVMIPGLSE